MEALTATSPLTPYPLEGNSSDTVLFSLDNEGLWPDVHTILPSTGKLMSKSFILAFSTTEEGALTGTEQIP